MNSLLPGGVFGSSDGVLPSKTDVKKSGDDSVWWINAALLPEGLSGEEVGTTGFFKATMVKLKIWRFGDRLHF